MKTSFLCLAVPALALSLAAAAERDAAACGGCAVPPDTNTQVTGHRMIVATSMTQTTLYDQIQYTGDPQSFAWFLPIKGEVTVGLSADALFALLSNNSQVAVTSPPLNCRGSNRGGGPTLAAAESSDGSGSSGVDQDVNVISKETVGPYETVQLSARTPDALTQWLQGHGYSIPADVVPIIQAYQQEGFDFLAMKLVPGQGVTSMRPVRVTLKGAQLSFPLRMVAAGTGARTPVLLHVVSEGRYEVKDRPNIHVKPELLVWDWGDNTSNYRSVRESLVDETGGFAWLTESAQPFLKDNLANQVKYTLQASPGTSGWGDPMKGVSEQDDATADLDTLFAGMSPDHTWLNRLYANLTRPALAQDLELQASADQTPISRFLQAKESKGTPPCSQDVFACSAPAAPQNSGVPALLVGTGLLAALAWARRRRG